MIVDHNPELLNAIVRRDLFSFIQKVFGTLTPAKTFVPGWYVEAVAHELERVRRGEVRRLIINMPPRSLKSIAASVAFPGFVLGHDPSQRIICVSYSSDLSHKMSNDFRAVLGSPWYRTAFPMTRIGGKDSQGEIELTRRGSRLATAVEGTLTGRGGDIIIIDDPLKGSDALSAARRDAVNQWYVNTLLSRLDDKQTGAIIIVMQRLHVEDLTGFVLGGPENWMVLSLPAIAESDETILLPGGRSHSRRTGDVLCPDREDLDALNSMKMQIGGELFSAQYQQAPVPPGGAMIKRAWVKRYETLPAFDQAPMTIQSWDTAAKGGPENDWSVCTTWKRDGTLYYLVNVWRERVDYPTLKAQVVCQAQQWRPDQVLVEEAGTAIALLEELRGTVSGLTAVRPDRDKITRMSIASAKFQAEQVLFPTRAPWLADLEAELFAFPGGRHDDQVDSISQAVNAMADMFDAERFISNLQDFTMRVFGH